MTDTYELWVPGRPVPKERPQFSRRGKQTKVRTPPATMNYQSLIRDYWLSSWGTTSIDGPLSVFVDLTVEGVNITIHPIEHTGTKLRGDVDNYIKSVLDGLQGAAFPNDSMVQEVWAAKL